MTRLQKLQLASCRFKQGAGWFALLALLPVLSSPMMLSWEPQEGFLRYW